MTKVTRAYQRLLMILMGLTAAVVVLSTSAVKTQEPETVSVRLDWVVSGYHAPFFVGVEKGFYKEEGLTVDILPGNGSSMVAQAVGSSNDDFGVVDGGTMMNLVSKGLPIKAIMGINQRSPLSVIYRVDTPITTPSDLYGRKVASTSGQAPQVMWPAFVKAAGLDESKITVINANSDSMRPMLINKQVDALLGFNYLTVPSLRNMGLEAAALNYADYGVNIPGLAIVSNIKFLDENEDVTKRFLRATARAYEWTIADPEAAIDILIAANPTSKLDRETSLTVLIGSLPLLHTEATKDLPVGVMAESDWAAAEALLVEYQGVRKAEGIDTYFTNKYLQ